MVLTGGRVGGRAALLRAAQRRSIVPLPVWLVLISSFALRVIYQLHKQSDSKTAKGTYHLSGAETVAHMPHQKLENLTKD
jgi:hypothetical protein